MKTPSPSINPYIGQRIRMERKRMGISQETLASDLNVSVNYIGAIERGKRVISLNLAEKICTYFHLTLDYLYRGITPDVVAEQMSYESNPYRELMQILELCSEQEARLCLEVVKPILVVWRSNIASAEAAEADDPAYLWSNRRQ